MLSEYYAKLYFKIFEKDSRQIVITSTFEGLKVSRRLYVEQSGISISGSATLRYLLKRSERVNIPGAQIVHELAITHDQHKQASGIQF